MELTYKDVDHDYIVSREPDGRIMVTVDSGNTGHGYLAGNVVRFPKGLKVGSKVIMTLVLPSEIIRSL